MSYLSNFNPEKINNIPDVKQQFRVLKKAIDDGEIDSGVFAYKTIDIGDQSNFTGTYPDGQYTISYSGSDTLYNTINAIWASGKIPVLKMALTYHTSAYSIPLYKAPDNNFDGHERAENGNYTVDVIISSGGGVINTRSIGTYTKPSGGIPKTDFAQAVQDILNMTQTIVFLSEDGSVLSGLEGTLPAPNEIRYGRFIYSDGVNVVPLSVSYNSDNNIITASGMFIPYGEINPKLIYFSCNYAASSIEETEVTIKDL